MPLLAQPMHLLAQMVVAVAFGPSREWASNHPCSACKVSAEGTRDGSKHGS